MKPKAIKDMCQLTDEDLFIQVSEGLGFIIEHMISIESDVRFLAEHKRLCAFNILESVLKEESAKFLILLDAIRCPRIPSNIFSRQLALFDKHLAKGIYSLVYSYRPQDFREIRKAVEIELQQFYLDGPNDYDWIFKNEIQQMREEKLYVDYIASDGNHLWLTPKRYYNPEFSTPSVYLKPAVFEVSWALWHAGCTNPEALLCIANNWRSIQISDDFDWKELQKLNIKTLDDLDAHNLIKTKEEKIIRTIIDKWLFPLYTLDLKIKSVNEAELREIREQYLMNLE